MSDHDIISVGLGKIQRSTLCSTKVFMGLRLPCIDQIDRTLAGDMVISQHDARNILDVLIKENEKYVTSNGEPSKLLAELIGAWIPCAISSTKQPRGQ